MFALWHVSSGFTAGQRKVAATGWSANGQGKTPTYASGSQTVGIAFETTQTHPGAHPR